MRAAVDENLCMCTGFCARIAPELFKVDTDTAATVVLPEVPAELADVAREAEAACPAAAIVVTD